VKAAARGPSRLSSAATKARARRPTEASPRYEDPRFDEVVAAFARNPRLAPAAASLAAAKAGRDGGSGGKFGSKALKVNGKIFAMVVNGRLVVKLAKERVDQLVGARQAAYFDPGHGRLMKQWATILDAKLSWLALATEAHDFVGGQRGA